MAKKHKIAIIVLVVVAILVGVYCVFAEKFQYESFEEWVVKVNTESLEYFTLDKGYGNETIRYTPTKEEFEAFYEFFKSIPEEKCFRRVLSVEQTDYHLYFKCGIDEVLLHCLEDGTVSFVGSTEMTQLYPEGKVLIIDSPELWHYIVDTVDEKGVRE